MKLITNLMFSGNCREAFDFYAVVLGGEIKAMIPFGEVPEERILSEDFADTIFHAWLEIDGHVIMGCDAPPQVRRPMSGFTVAIQVADPDEARRTFECLMEGGTASMPFGRTFWSPGFGMGFDRFGVPWSVNTSRADVSGVAPADHEQEGC